MSEETGEPASEILIYQTDDGRTRLDVRFENETVWLSQALMAELFQTSPQNITQHLKTLYQEGKIREAATCKEFLQVGQEGKRSIRRASERARRSPAAEYGTDDLERQASAQGRRDRR